jgi:hypothetical protein
MRVPFPFQLMILSITLGLAACGGNSGDGTGGSGGGGRGGGGTGGGTTATGASANGLFEIHYKGDLGFTSVEGIMNDGPTTEAILWDKKKTDGDCSLYTPRAPFCESCVSPGVCVADNVCRTPPGTHGVGQVSVTGLSPPSGANPLVLTDVRTSTGVNYQSVESLPLPPCTAGGPIRLDATGEGEYPAFKIQAQCIAPLAVTNTSIAIESGKVFTLTWTPGAIADARIKLEFDLSHHGGSKGRLICDTADTGSLQVSGSLVKSLMDLGVTGYPKADVTRILTGKSTVGSGQAELKVYSDMEYVVGIPGLKSCQSDAECTAPQTCQVPGQMCGISCKSDADCPSGQTCLTTTNICK